MEGWVLAKKTVDIFMSSTVLEFLIFQIVFYQEMAPASTD